MQSGIKASEELHEAFRSLLADTTVFALPITISKESLTPSLPLVYFRHENRSTDNNSSSSNNKINDDSSTSSSPFYSSLSQLEPHLQPSQPCYLVLRRTPGGDLAQQKGEENSWKNYSKKQNLVLITYIPSTSPVRAKTLFASTRMTLFRELGMENFEGGNENGHPNWKQSGQGNGGESDGGNLFVTEASEILDTKEWMQRDGRMNRSAEAVEAEKLSMLSREEKDLWMVRRAEEEEVRGMQGRGMMGMTGATAASAAAIAAGRGGESGGPADNGAVGLKKVGVQMKMADEVEEALVGLGKDSEGQGSRLLQLHIDISTETLNLSPLSDPMPSPAHVSSAIPADRPSYSFYRYASASAGISNSKTIFIYCCPNSSKVKERMLYASSRAGVVQAAQEAGVRVTKKIEVGAPDEVDEARLVEEMKSVSVRDDSESQMGAVRQGFARPPRPGKR